MFILCFMLLVTIVFYITIKTVDNLNKYHEEYNGIDELLENKENEDDNCEQLSFYKRKCFIQKMIIKRLNKKLKTKKN
jgi:hypothetical protein